MHHFVAYFLLAAFAQGQTKQEAMNRAMRHQFEARFSFLSDSRTDAYLRSVADRLHLPDSSEIHVAIDRARWTNVLPDGVYYTSTELLRHLEDESELAAVLAHLAAHRGEFKLLSGSSSSPSIPVIWTHDGGLCARFAKSSLLPISVRENSKSVEKDATMQAVERLQKANYDTTSLAKLFPDDGVERTVRTGTIVSTQGFIEMQGRLPVLEKPAIVPSLYQKGR